MTDPAPPAAPRAPRPRLHFTARRGWINDPHGVVRHDGGYHLFFQHQPAGTVWANGIVWGHATSPDLLHWTEQEPALEPEPGEGGCWSGSLVAGPEGPAILYTSAPSTGSADLPLIRLAHGDDRLAAWRRDAAVGVAAPAGTLAFRDPAAWRDGDGWAMVVGASLPGDAGPMGAALLYRSPDLRTWTYEGPVADAAGLVRDAGGRLADLGTMWECPHLFEVDGSWVLLFSVWDRGTLRHATVAVGDLDGGRFTARDWHRFTHGEVLYATTTFVDADGRRCVVSWLRDDPRWEPDGRDRAGATSLPYVVRVTGDRLTAALHPEIADVAAGRGTELRWDPRGVTVPSPVALVAVPLPAGGTARVTLGGAVPEGAPAGALPVSLVAEGDRLHVTDAGGAGLADVPRRPDAPAGELLVVVDGGIVEAVVPGVDGPVAVHCGIPGDGPVRIGVTCADEAPVRVFSLG